MFTVVIATVALLWPGFVFAQSKPTPPIPVWSGEGSVPRSYGNRKVFLSPDGHSVILLWPDENGSKAKLRRLPLHNEMCASLRVGIKRNAGSFVYTYDLENEKGSKDSVNTFSIVIYPDPSLQAGAELWRGMKSTAIVGKRIGIPGAPDGGLVLWSSPERQPLLPGEVTKFTISTEARPGFTTAATEHYPHLDLTDEWPEQILDELEPVLTPRWIDQHILTLGPRYGPDEPASQIAADYLVGIRELIRRGQLIGTSTFVRDVMGALDPVATHGTSASLSVTAKPQTTIEAEILNALRLSLNLTTAVQ